MHTHRHHSNLAPERPTASRSPLLDVLSLPTSPGTAASPAGTDALPLPSEVERIIAEDGACRPCANSSVVLIKLAQPPEVIRARCRSWRCPSCSAAKLRAARLMIGEGLRAAIDRGDEIRLITLTDPPARPLLAKALSEALDRLTSLLGKGGPAPRRPPKGSGGQAQKAWRKKCMRRVPLIRRWVAVIEIAPRSRRVHVHLLVTGPDIPQALLASCVRTAGFGSVFDVRLVKTEHDVEETVARLSTYLSKSNPAEGLLRRGATRVRPIHQGRKERTWYPGGLRYAEEQLGIRGPVPGMPRREGWFRAIVSPAGTVLKVSPLKSTTNAC